MYSIKNALVYCNLLLLNYKKIWNLLKFLQYNSELTITFKIKIYIIFH